MPARYCANAENEKKINNIMATIPQVHTIGNLHIQLRRKFHFFVVQDETKKIEATW